MHNLSQTRFFLLVALGFIVTLVTVIALAALAIGDHQSALACDGFMTLV